MQPSTYFRIGVSQRILKDQMTIGNELARMSVNTGQLIQLVLNVIKTDGRFDDTRVVLEMHSTIVNPRPIDIDTHGIFIFVDRISQEFRARL
jgi:hypothetical protein